MRRPLLVVSTLLALAACGDATRPTGPVMGNAPSFAISDGANSGGGPANGDFFFLPPMVPDPSGALTYDAGAFDATMSPRVEICLLTTTEPRACAAEPFRVLEGAAISVSTTDEHYHVNWHTNEDDLSVDQLYRIAVSVPRREHDGQMHYRTLGFADVDPVNTGKELKNIATGQVIGLVDGRTLPIKFRIERSPLCEESDDCVEAILTDEGGRVETETGYAIAEFPAGWLPEGFEDEDVVVAIRRVAIGSAPGQDPSCHGSTHVQYEGCYDFETFPDVGTFALPAVISTCIEPDAFPWEDQLQLAASDDGENFRFLPPREVVIECEGFQGTPAPIGFLGRIGERMLAFGERLGVALAPRKLYAVDKGRGGAIDSFSNAGWVLPVQLTRLTPEDETHVTSPGSAVPVSILVYGAHESNEDGAPVANRAVAFSVSEGGGTVDLPLALTNADGVASTTWTVGGVGEHVLTATIGDQSISVTAEVVEEPSGEIIFGVESNTDGLTYIEPGTGAATFVGRASPDLAEFTTPVAMARHPVDGRLFIWNNSGTTSDGVLAMLNVCTGIATAVGEESGLVMGALAFAPGGQLYGFGGTLYQIDAGTGDASPIGSELGATIGGADFGPDGVLYAVALGGGSLYTVSTETGTVSLLADLSDQGTIGSIAFDGEGRLWATAFNGEPGDVLFEISLDPESLGAISNVRTITPGNTPQGMAFAPPPICIF
jgi:hypothetical protein